MPRLINVGSATVTNALMPTRMVITSGRSLERPLRANDRSGPYCVRVVGQF